jgi:HEAT repeat protein
MDLRSVTASSAADLCDAVREAGPEDVAAVLDLVGHESADLRWAVAVQLPYLSEDAPSDELIAAAIGLTTDLDPDVRDWACFALGQQWRELDTPSIREALAARLDDIDVDTRYEALVGLANRQDQRALPYVRAALSGADVYRLALVAAGALGDPTQHPLVLRHLSGGAESVGEGAAECARRLTDPTGPGDDVIEGVAALVRLRAHGLNGDAQLRWWRLMLDLLDIAPHRALELYDAVAVRLAGDEKALTALRTDTAIASLAGMSPDP